MLRLGHLKRSLRRLETAAQCLFEGLVRWEATTFRRVLWLGYNFLMGFDGGGGCGRCPPSLNEGESTKSPLQEKTASNPITGPKLSGAHD